MEKLTKLQQEYLGFIYSFIQFHEYSPTVHEIADYFNVAYGTAQDHIRALIIKGYLSKEKNKRRVFKIIKKYNEGNKT